MKDREKGRGSGPVPESGMGGANDAGAGGGHPASRSRVPLDSAVPGSEPGDASVERRRREDPAYRGPERRIARQGA
jgi:hypothetical protein